MLLLASLAGLALSLTLPLASPGSVSANGAGGGVLEVRLEKHLVEVRGAPRQPSVGVWHLSVFALDGEEGQPVTGYQVQLAATPPSESGDDPQAPLTFEGVPCPFAAECRDINVELDRPGEWRMALTIDSPLGKETAQFAVRVKEGGIDIGRYTLNGLLVILVALLALTTRMWWRPWVRRLAGGRKPRRSGRSRQ